MKLGLNFGQDFLTRPDNLALAQEAERLGFDVCFAAEAYGSDAVSVLAHLAAHTTTIGLGSAVLQVPARTPAMTAMTTATLDRLSGGRFRLGLGPSGAQVSEGWHGVPFAKPLSRTREYVDVVQRMLRRERIESDGPHYPLPLPGGVGIPLKLIIRPLRETVPVYLAATGPSAIELAGEVADGWLGLFHSADQIADALTIVESGRRRSGKQLSGFDVVASVPVAVHSRLDAAADLIRDYVALYVGGMGSKKKNYYNELASNMGFEEEARSIQEKYLSGDKEGAGLAVPFDLIDRTSLMGDVDRMAARMGEFAGSGVTTLAVTPMNYADTFTARCATLRTVVRAWEKSGTTE